MTFKTYFYKDIFDNNFILIVKVENIKEALIIFNHRITSHYGKEFRIKEYDIEVLSKNSILHLFLL